MKSVQRLIEYVILTPFIWVFYFLYNPYRQEIEHKPHIDKILIISFVVSFIYVLLIFGVAKWMVF